MFVPAGVEGTSHNPEIRIRNLLAVVVGSNPRNANHGDPKLLLP